jgi:outer membrane immunogenic protein
MFGNIFEETLIPRGLPVKKLLASTSFIVLSSITVLAADLPLRTKAPVMAAPVFSWTGCYVGAQVGGGWSRHDITEFNQSNTPKTVTGALDSSGGLFGGQLGCNYQSAGMFVVGVQGDIAGTNINGKAYDPTNQALAQIFNQSFLFTHTVGVKTDYLASLTGRIGVTGWNNQALFYVKGGGAWTHNKWDFSNASGPYFIVTPPMQDGSFSGWTIGGGVEWVMLSVSPKLSAFVEANYYSFGNFSTTTFVGGNPNFQNTFSSKQAIETVKVGLNYRLFQ